MSQTYNICLLPGDGIGPEIIAEGVKVLNAVGAKYDTTFSYTEALIGGCAIDETGSALPDETLAVANASDAVLLAAVGGPKWDTTDPAKPRPEQGLLGIRKALGLYTNLRPVQILPALYRFVRFPLVQKRLHGGEAHPSHRDHRNGESKRRFCQER